MELMCCWTALSRNREKRAEASATEPPAARKHDKSFCMLTHQVRRLPEVVTPASGSDCGP